MDPMSITSKGFLAAAAVCAVVAGGWIFWEEGMPLLEKAVYGDPVPLYWDVHGETDDKGYVQAVVLDYTLDSDEPQYFHLWVYRFKAEDPDSMKGMLDPGTHSIRIPGSVPPNGYDPPTYTSGHTYTIIPVLDASKASMDSGSHVECVRTDGGRPPAR